MAPILTAGRFGFASSGEGPFVYNSFFSFLSSEPFDFSQYEGTSGEVTIFTVYGEDGTAAASGPGGGGVHPGAPGGGSQAKYRSMPIDSFTAAYGSDVTITNTMTAPYWASTDGNVTVPPVGQTTRGNTFPTPSITNFNNLFPGHYVFSAGSGGAGGVSPGNQYGGRGGGGGAGGLNINQIGSTPIPPDPAAAPGGRGGNAGGTPGEWPGRDGAPGGQGGGGQYGSGGGGGGSGSELSGSNGSGGAGGAGQGGLTIIHVYNDGV